ncbi:hypothetical protein WR25_06187 [Diploscapter pachys]|uniref:glutathione transferase n=1 Tax=Diploscapter pachys TaxID=2018661 RepID=A0A2A2LSQ9_9BILA|nr:hypothetical protein WR25_06187 [Diploscapter pachys]
MVVYKLYYFQARGFAEMARQLFALSETPYEDVRFEFNDWPNHKSSYAGKTPLEEALVDSWGDLFKDYMFEASSYFYAMRDQKPNVEELRTTVFIPAAERLLTNLRDHLKTSKSGFIVDSGLTWVDLGFADHFIKIKEIWPEAESKFPEIQEYQKRVQSIPKIKEWIEKRPQTQF